MEGREGASVRACEGGAYASNHELVASKECGHSGKSQGDPVLCPLPHASPHALTLACCRHLTAMA